MGNPEHLSKIREGVEPWNAWREANLQIRPDLFKANLSGAKLSEAILSWAKLIEANLSGAKLRGADLREVDFSWAKLIEADLSGANLRGADLRGANLVQTNLENANLAGCRIYGINAWDLKLEGAKQSNLVITTGDQPTITVDDLEVAQFIYLLLYNESIRNVIDTIGKKGVLIIGRFTEERKAILHAIRDELRNRYDLVPIMFEFDPLSTEPTIKTLSTLAHLSRFVIADLTDAKSVLQELERISHDLPTLPVQPILFEGAELPPMAESFLILQSVLELYIYSTREKLMEDLPDNVIAPAEDCVKTIESKLVEIRQKYLPWQSK